jgi:hypothetical protein
MPRFLIVIFTILACSLLFAGCASILGSVDLTSTNPQSLAFTPTVKSQQPGKATASPVPSSTPTTAPTATIDPGLAASATVLALQGQQIAATQTVAALEAIAGAATGTSAPLTSTAVRQSTSATETKTVYMTNIAPTAYVALQNAEREDMVNDLAVIVLAILAVTIPFGILIIRGINASRDQYQAWAVAKAAEHAANQSTQAEPRRVVVETRNTEGTAVNWTTLPISRDVFLEVLEMLENGSHYTQAQMTGEGNPLSKSNGKTPGTFDHFGQWMVENGFATRTAENRYILLDNAAKRMRRYVPLSPSE